MLCTQDITTYNVWNEPFILLFKSLANQIYFFLYFTWNIELISNIGNIRFTWFWKNTEVACIFIFSALQKNIYIFGVSHFKYTNQKYSGKSEQSWSSRFMVRGDTFKKRDTFCKLILKHGSIDGEWVFLLLSGSSL